MSRAGAGLGGGFYVDGDGPVSRTKARRLFWRYPAVELWTGASL